MTVEFIGFIGTRKHSEIHPASGPVIDVDYLDRFASAHEQGGFDRVLIAFHATAPDSLLVAAHAAAVTKRLGFMIAHRPGFTAPTVAARQFATLDQLTGGRIAVHIITGGDDREMRQDGDYLTKDQRYARTDEYLGILRRIWTSDTPFDHDGKYYRGERMFSEVKAIQKPHIPVYFGGASDPAIAVAGKHADIYALWGETHAQVRELTARVRAAAAKNSRQVRFSVSLRPIIANTEEKAWARADAILERARDLQEQTGFKRTVEPANAGSQRLLAAAAKGTRLDKRLWTAMAALTGAKGNSTALVGTPEQVADALLDYYNLGVTTFLIRSFDPLEDAVAYGRDLIPLVRTAVAERVRDGGPVAV
ncbi:MAG: LLM class flavin-dependent oxidoreductase [Rhodospirillales bacterium]|nr:LLM class flavin-dependent oxidoreductase [Rhodospirillales bacterium]